MRYYVRKTNRGNTPQKCMQEAAFAVIKEGKSLRAIAKEFGICHATLFRFIRKLKSGENPTVGYKPKLLFTAEQEQEIVKHLVLYAKVICGLTIEHIRKLSCQFAKRWKYNIPEGWIKNNMASKDWADKFVLRHNIPVKPTKDSNINSFYNQLYKLIEEHKYLPSRIYYLEEITISMVKCAYKKSTTKIGLTYDHACMTLAANALGDKITPLFLLNSVKYGLRDRSKLCIAKTGSMNSTDFLKYLNQFIDHTQPCKTDPLLLILDSDKYIDISVLKKASQNSITLLCLPKSMDTMEPFVKVAEYVKKDNLKRILSKPQEHDVLDIVSEVTPTSVELVDCFRKNGVWPFNPSVITGGEFVADPGDEYDFKVNHLVVLPGGAGPSNISNTKFVSATDVPKDQDPLSRNTIDQCRFCGEFCKECVPVSSMHLSTNTTTIAFNEIVVQLDFSDRTLPHTVCKHCDAKLQEMFDFVKLVKNAQKSLISVGENVTEVEVENAREDVETVVVKTEYEEDSDEADSEESKEADSEESEKDEEDSKSGIVDSVSVGETIFIKENLGTQKRKMKELPKNPKKAKADNKSENETELIIDIKEEVIELDENDGDTGCKVSDTGTDVKPSETELATSALVYEMKGDGAGQGYS